MFNPLQSQSQFQSISDSDNSSISNSNSTSINSSRIRTNRNSPNTSHNNNTNTNNRARSHSPNRSPIPIAIDNQQQQQQQQQQADNTINSNNNNNNSNTNSYILGLLFILICCSIFLFEYIHWNRANNNSSAAAIIEDPIPLLIDTQSLLNSRIRELNHLLIELSDRELKLLYLQSQYNHQSVLINEYELILTELNTNQFKLIQQAQSLINNTYHYKSATIETITRIGSNHHNHNNNNNNPLLIENSLDSNNQPNLDGNGNGGGGVLISDKLIDSDNNEYILSNPSNLNDKHIDNRLVLDLGIVIIASALGGLLASISKQSILLGYLLGGSIIGPGGFKLIDQFIQIETLAEFGSTFLLFALGVEFNLTKLKSVKYIAILGGSLSLFIIVIITVITCQLLLLFSTAAAAANNTLILFNLTYTESIFIGCIFSMSSTTVVIKSLIERRELNQLSGIVMTGLLIIQDLYLSLLLALKSLATVNSDSIINELILLFSKFILLALIVIICMLLYPIALKLLDSSNSHDLFLLGLVALCCLLTRISEQLIHSAEVGAFLSGILISSSPWANSELTNRALRLFAPIRDLFGALFFSAIGMLINPAFLIEKLLLISIIVVLIIIIKTIIISIIIKFFGYSWSIAIRCGLGLSQIGEFAFVLASEGLSVKLISTEIYLLLLGVTAVSIFITPFIFMIADKLIPIKMANNNTNNNNANTSSSSIIPLLKEQKQLSISISQAQLLSQQQQSQSQQQQQQQLRSRSGDYSNSTITNRSQSGSGSGNISGNSYGYSPASFNSPIQPLHSHSLAIVPQLTLTETDQDTDTDNESQHSN